jgi:hypothetical protein
MRNSQNHKKHVNYFFGGADYDINEQLASIKQGFYKDANNMRLYTGEGNIRRIYGETLKYYTTAKNFTCIGAVEVNYNIVEVWIKDDNSLVRFRVNGVVMCQTDLLGFTRTRKLQMDKADDCPEGLFFITDNNVSPYIFSIKDIIDNYNVTSKYFADFNPQLYSVNLTIPNNIPVFRRLVTGALPVGQYAYSIRFVDSTGNRTKFSMPTPMIPVPLNYEKGSNAHPYNSTHGGVLTDGTGTSPYGIRIQFRINNVLNYSYVEVRRISVNTLQALNETPVAEVRSLTTLLAAGEISTWTFDDDGNYDDWEVLTDDESTDTMAAIESAKAIRYFNGNLVLGNVKLASKEITGATFNTYQGATAFPFIDNLGEVGYYSPHNSAYKKSYMSGERYGFGIACLDWQNNVGFVIPIDDVAGVLDFGNYKFPERREQLNAATYDLSVNNWKGASVAADISNTVDGIAPNSGCYVHEKFSKGMVFKPFGNRTISKVGYNPYRPKTYDDTVVSGLNIQPNKAVATIAENTLVNNQIPSGNIHTYNPNFSIEFYGMGIAVAGIENLPEWVTSFAIVRTKPAGRVVCQGITTYNMTDAPQSKSNIKSSTNYNLLKKSLNAVSFFSDEVKAGYTGLYANNKFIQNELQPVSPLGYFSELYTGQKDYLGNVGDRMYDKGIDIIIYAREFVTDANFPTSPALLDVQNGTKYWTKFGKWRNDNSDIVSGDTKYPISSDANESFKSVGLDGYLKITLGNNIYKTESPAGLTSAYGSSLNCNNTQTKNWHEPFYISNIIDDDKDIPDNNQTEFVLTGHYQKIQSIIGKGTDEAQDIMLVDERWEDCCVNQFNAVRPTYIYIRNATTGNDQAWIDITMYGTSPVNFDTTVIAALNATGYYDATDPITGVVTRCYGVYTHEISSTVVETGDWTIKFAEVQGLAKQFCVPNKENLIVVKYDSRFPVKAFGGDTIIGESCFALVDGQSDANGDVKNNKQLFAWVGFPYSAYDITTMVKNAASAADFQSPDFVVSNIFRQIIVSAVVESRIHLPYAYNQKTDGTNYVRGNNFPRVHYVLRPIKWNASTIANNFAAGGGGISDTYQTDYPLEHTAWERGGFRSIQGYNRDYSKGNNYDIQFSKPQVGYTEKTSFCTRNIWSVKRNINVQDDPNLKTFLSLNAFDINDSTGEIKYLYDNMSEKGNNLFAITERGVCLLITDKRIISDIQATELFVMESDKLIKGEYWLSKNTGSNGEMWRGIAEYNNMLFFPNSESVYMMVGMQIKDILRQNKGSYYKRLHPKLQDMLDTYPMTGCYNIDNQEYWLYLGYDAVETAYEIVNNNEIDENIISPKNLRQPVIPSQKETFVETLRKLYAGETFVYKVDSEAFTGTFEYRGDKFLTVQGNSLVKQLQILIMRNYETYEEGIGIQINGVDVEGSVQFVVAPEGHLLKEVIDASISSSLIPTKAELSTVFGTVEATQTYFKNYSSFYFQVPRKATGNRLQGKALFVRVYNNVAGDFDVTSVESGYKVIK